MARRYQLSAPRGQAPRRATDWIGGINVAANTTAIAAGVSQIVASFDSRTNASVSWPCTVVRARGYLTVSAGASNASLNAQGAFGMCIVNGEAFDAGAAAIISPWTEAFDDRWFYHTYWSWDLLRTAAGENIYSGFQHVIDSKAMRKFENGDVIVWMIENASADPAEFQVNIRTLLKVH